MTKFKTAFAALMTFTIMTIGAGALMARQKAGITLPDGGAKTDAAKLELKPLAEARIRVAKEALEILRAQQAKSTISPNHPDFSIWLRRIAETRREMGGNKDAVIIDLTEYRDHTRLIMENVKIHKNQGLQSDSALLEARYQALEAEAWLAEALNK